MNVAFVSTGSPAYDDYPDPASGTSVQIWKLAVELARRGEYVTIFRATFGTTSEWTTDHGIRIVDVPRPNIDAAVNGLFSKLLFSKRVAQRLAHNSFDVVFLRERTTAIFPVRLDLPTVYTVISPDACDFFYNFSVQRHWANRLLFRYKRYIEEYVIEYADATIVMNKEMHSYFEGKGFDSIHTVSIAVNIDNLPEPKPNSDRCGIVYAGRIDYNKRADLLLQAYDEIETDHPLDFYGEGPEMNNLRRSIEERGLSNRVTCHGHISHDGVLQAMGDAAAFVLPSRYDNSPNVVLEALATGCPVLASDTRGARSMLIDNETGLLFDRTSLEALRDKLSNLLKNPSLRQHLSTRGREYVRNNHDVSSITDAYLDVYSDVESLDD